MCGYTFAYKALLFRSKKLGNSKMFAVNIFLFVLKLQFFSVPEPTQQLDRVLVISDKMIRTVRLHNIDHW